MSHNVETMMYVGTTPWHLAAGLTTSREVRESASRLGWRDAVKLAGLDWRVNLRPVYSMSGPMADPESEIIALPGFRSVVRDSDNSGLGIVTDSYKAIQNSELFGLFGEAFGKELTLETAGSLKGGKEVWGLAAIPENWTVANESHRRYLLLTGRHDGTGSAQARLVLERVVCSNTLRIALGERGTDCDLRIAHRGDVATKIDNAGDALALAFRKAEDFKATAEKLRELRLSAVERAETVKEIVDLDTPRGVDICDEIMALCRGGIGNSEIGETGWGVLQGVTDYVDHHRMLGKPWDRRLYYQHDGSGGQMKARALKTLTRKVA